MVEYSDHLFDVTFINTFLFSHLNTFLFSQCEHISHFEMLHSESEINQAENTLLIYISE